MLCSIALQIAPKVIRQRVFLGDGADVSSRVRRFGSLVAVFRMEDASELRPGKGVGQFEVIERKIRFLAKSDDENSLPLLGDK